MKNLLILFCLVITVNTSYAQDKVTWIVEKFEPYYILDGKLKGQGAADRLVALLQKEMPELKHETNFVPILRIREELKDKEHVVCISFLKDKTLSDYVQYSVATMLVPALELTMRRDVWETTWHSSPSVSVAELMGKNGIIGVAEGRRYGDKVDPILADHVLHKSSSIYERVGNHYSGLAEMVESKRIQATIGYSAELRYNQKLNPALKDLVSIPITENMQALYAYTIIPKGEWGDQFREKINRVLRKIRTTPEYKRAMTDWFGDTPAWEQEYQSRFATGKMDGATAGM